MSSQGDATLPVTRRTRKSIGGRSPSRKVSDKENATVDLGSAMAASRKKSRSKSMGPAGLDALKSGTGNRRASLAVPSRPPPRSILKPTIPLLPEIPPHRPRMTGANLTDSGDNTGTKVALRTEEEQQAAAREREERERAELEKEIKDRREARRKSLANRRVSFAAEATLHTFHEVEYMQDSTTSTDSTRRASSVAAPSPAPRQSEPQGSDPSEPPSTPPEAAHGTVTESPANQRDPHQRRHRRSSGAASVGYDDMEDDTITSTVYDSDVEHAESVAEEMTDSSDDSEDDGTMMTVEAEEMTSASVASARSAFSADSSGDLDENLRLAAQMAATQRLDDDEEVIAGFAGWGKKNTSTDYITQNMAQATTRPEDDMSEAEMTMEMDMDMTNAVGGILKPTVAPAENEEDDGEDMDMSMDVTKTLGGILNSRPQNRRKSVRPSTRAAEDVTSFGDQTMEFTMAMGGIKHNRVSDVSHITTDSNEDMSMEITTAIGAVLGKNSIKPPTQNGRRQTIAAEDEASLMDMTTAVGRILPTEVPNDGNDVNDETMGMDMTMAVGGIIKSVLNPSPDVRSVAKKVMEQEADEPEPSVTASTEAQASSRRLIPNVPAAEPGPDPAAFRVTGLRRSPARAASPAKSSASEASSPLKATPEPSPASKARTPTRSKPAPVMIGNRSSSPVRQTSSPAKATPRSPLKSKKLFNHNPETGTSTPRVVLTPQGRRLSGVGADRPGLGSPKVAQIFDRRESIGDVAGDFVAGQASNVRRRVAFADPRVMEAEIDKEREAEEEQENSGRIFQREADGSQDADTTQSLKEMIQGLSPKKNPLRGRKSLHVGSARGILGKRPAELDDEEAEDMDGVKRLKGHQGSPVKNVKLQSPPSKAETTTGRKTRAGLRGGDDRITETITPTIAPSPKKGPSPKVSGRFKSVDDQPTSTVEFGHTAAVDDVDMQQDEDGERIHLQDFLNMTSIRFMELTTTKRRHTVVPSASRDSSAPDGKEDISLEKCVVAGACTVPMLELYQHSCRELKKYISEGRRIVREIETETFEENPPLFREYISASPEFKVLMDNQFKNVKSHARLLSKAMWYEWRMKLQDGLKEGLVNIAEGMDHDDKVLRRQQELLSSALPEMKERVEALEHEHEDLETVARELAECDPEELQRARAELVSTDKAIAERMKKIAELQREVEESDRTVDSLTKRKQECLDEIKEADKIREECRGWSATEISAIKARVDELEKRHGWAVTGISGTAISMTYKREIELVFDIAAFQPTSGEKPRGKPNIDLWYIAANRESNPLPSTPEKEFFLQCIRDHLRGVPQASTKANHLLQVVSSAWDKAKVVANQARFLNLTFPTTVIRTSDTSTSVKSSLLMMPLKTKVEIRINLQRTPGAEGVEVVASPEAKVVYGEQFNAAKMTEFLASKLAGPVRADGSMTAWSDAVLELQRKLLAKGQKAVRK